MGLVLGSAIGIIVAVLLFIAFVALLATGLAQGKSWSEFKAGYISAIVTGVLALFVGAVSVVILRRSTAIGRKGLGMGTALLGDYQRQQQQAVLRAQQQAYFDQGRSLQVGDNPAEALRQYERAQATRQMQEEAFRLGQEVQPVQPYFGAAYPTSLPAPPPPYVAQQPIMPFSPPPQGLPPAPSTQMSQQPTFVPAAQTTMPQQQAKPLPPVPETLAASSASKPQSGFQRFAQAGKTAIAAAPGAIDAASQLAGVAAQAAGPKYAKQAEQFQQGAARARQTALQAQEAQRILEQQQQQWRAAQQQARA